jgi:hypothetical protein
MSDSVAVPVTSGSYRERALLVATMAKMALALGYKAGLGRDIAYPEGSEWSHVIFIDLPTGQVSWHVHESDLDLVDLPPYHTPWDNHDDGAKFDRLRGCTFSAQTGPYDHVAAFEFIREKIPGRHGSFIVGLYASWVSYFGQAMKVPCISADPEHDGTLLYWNTKGRYFEVSVPYSSVDDVEWFYRDSINNQTESGVITNTWCLSEYPDVVKYAKITWATL